MELLFGFGKEVIHRNVMFVRCLVASKCCLCGQAQVGSHTRAPAAHFVTSQSSTVVWTVWLVHHNVSLKGTYVNVPGCLTLFRVVSLCAGSKGLWLVKGLTVAEYDCGSRCVHCVDCGCGHLWLVPSLSQPGSSSEWLLSQSPVAAPYAVKHPTGGRAARHPNPNRIYSDSIEPSDTVPNPQQRGLIF